MPPSDDEFQDATSSSFPTGNEINNSKEVPVITNQSTKNKKKKNKKKNKKQQQNEEASVSSFTGESSTYEENNESNELVNRTEQDVNNNENFIDKRGNDDTITEDTEDVNNPIGNETEQLKVVLPNPVKVATPDTSFTEESPDEKHNSRLPNGKPTLPSRKPILECLRLDQPSAQILEGTSETTNDKMNTISNSYRKESNNFLLESKFNQLNREFESKDLKLKELINSGTENIKKTFNDIKNTVGGFSEMFDYQIDWDFWTRIVNDYESVIQNESNELNNIINKGIPKEFRGIIWQLIAKSKNFQMEEFYFNLKSESSVHEKSIKRDLTRTSFFTNVEQVNKGEELFNVIKAYSLFDPDVGYTQGMIFITVPLIMNMSESECFCLLVTLMKDYNLRSLFCPEMKGLHLLLYEFDRLLEINLPNLYNHLVKQGIKSSMYASQWFLTFFAYKFPLDIVLRIYDILITQGIESILKFAVNLMIKNESNITLLKFDKLLDFLKNNLFNVYVNDEFINGASSTNSSQNDLSGSGVSRRFSLLGGRRGSTGGARSKSHNYYKLNELVEDSMQINVVPLDLSKFEAEFENIYLNEKSKATEIESLRIENGKLRHDIKLLETDFASLNRDHINIVQKMVDIKVTLPDIVNDNEDLQRSIAELKGKIEDLESKINAGSGDNNSSESSLNLQAPALPTNIESNIQELLTINAQETERFANLEEELSNLQMEDERLTSELLNIKQSKWIFNRWK